MKLTVVITAILGTFASGLTVPSPPSGQAYEMTLVPVVDARSAQPKYVFVVGHHAFLGIDGLREVVAYLNPGSTLTWNPGCEHASDEPEIFRDEAAIRAFKDYCAARGIKFIFIPAG
jgi:hypothetical protein